VIRFLANRSLHALLPRLPCWRDINVGEIERHRAGVDRRKIQDVVDERQQCIGRGGDVAEIFRLLSG
jgi:hypothetical protein